MGIYEDFTYNSCKTLQLVVLNLRDLWDHYLIFRKTPWDILRGEKHPNDEAQSPQSLTLDTIDNLESVFFWPGTEHGSLQTLHGVRTEGPAFPERLWIVVGDGAQSQENTAVPNSSRPSFLTYHFDVLWVPEDGHPTCFCPGQVHFFD